MRFTPAGGSLQSVHRSALNPCLHSTTLRILRSCLLDIHRSSATRTSKCMTTQKWAVPRFSFDKDTDGAFRTRLECGLRVLIANIRAWNKAYQLSMEVALTALWRDMPTDWAIAAIASTVGINDRSTGLANRAFSVLVA